MANRLPTPGGDSGDWGTILNDYLSVSLASDGTLNSGIVSSSNISSTAGITSGQLSSGVQTSLASANSAYQKPASGIPSTDMTSAVQTSLTSANSAVQSVNGLTGTSVNLTASNVGAGFTNNTMANRPTAASYTGWYFASDVNGGTLYYSNGSAWTQVDAGVSWGSGTQLAYAQTTSLNYAITNTLAPIAPGVLQVAVPASSVPVLVHGKAFCQVTTGTVASGTNIYLRLFITDSSNSWYDMSAFAIVASGTSATYMQGLYVATILPAPVSAGTYLLSASTNNPASGGTYQFVAGYGAFPTAWIEAVAH